MMNWLLIKDVRKRVFFTLFIVALFQIGTFIPLPFVTVHYQDGGALGSILTLATGGALSRFGWLMLGVSPYITSSIVIQILQKSSPKWQTLSKTADGMSKLGNYTRLLTILFAIIQGYSIFFVSGIAESMGATISGGAFEKGVILFCLVVGSVLVSYLGDKIGEDGVGQGGSVLVGIGILSTMPSQVYHIYSLYPIYVSLNQVGEYWKYVGIVFSLFLFILIASILVNSREIKYPIQSMTNDYIVEAHYYPVRLIVSSVMPVILASSSLAVAQFIVPLFGYSIGDWTNVNTIRGLIVYTIAIFFFSIFYNLFQVDPEELETSFKQSGVYFIGVRPTDVKSWLSKNVLRVTLIGTPLLVLIAISAILVQFFIPETFSLQSAGTSLLIVVGVMQEVFNQVKGLTQKVTYKELF